MIPVIGLMQDRVQHAHDDEEDRRHNARVGEGAFHLAAQGDNESGRVNIRGTFHLNFYHIRSLDYFNPYFLR